MNNLLGIECGATHTVALFEQENKVTQAEFGPANIRLINKKQISHLLQEIAKTFPKPKVIAIGMAGVRTATDQQLLHKAVEKAWPNTDLIHATNDLETALEADLNNKQTSRVLVLSGTGSCCYGKSINGSTSKLGGWGHILGDKSSGYEISLRALKACVFYLDRDGTWSTLGQRILHRLQLNSPDQLIDWAAKANKPEIAALAKEVFAAWAKRDKIAIDIIDAAASTLAKDACACAKKLTSKTDSIRFLLAGSVLIKQPKFAHMVAKSIRARRPGSQVGILKKESCWGSLELARKMAKQSPQKRSKTPFEQSSIIPIPDLALLDQAPTEQRHPLSINLDRMTLDQAIELFLNEDSQIPAAINEEKINIRKIIRWVVNAFKNDGRLFYCGAGTSGRLGILDASECPPTFRTDPEQVQGIIAGGFSAICQSVEGAEDDTNAGAEAIRFRGINKHDVFIGIAASGRTPFVWGGIWEANKRGAKTALLCFNPKLKIPQGNKPNIVINPKIGPELLTGSTRLKSGTATKLILNIITTMAMVQSGKVIGNLMVDLDPSNTKLRDRAVRIVQQLANADEQQARKTLEKNKWNVKKAINHLSKI
ncbi:MAG: N-acetylmuramic acid 6-phosphate etherase [Verrucomicrobiota bacterium]|nr:N-acetylmuramic acid 6-phosphate etherase [Verrucomicrobiota bacterium]MEE2615710.1 N-acetylmuramic acid 6-phosphate etherase [Verrucomicrobiota bacterium]